jgi:hypothetical protein
LGGPAADGFPRAGTSAEQKAEFHDALLLLTPPAAEAGLGGGGGGEGGGRGAGKGGRIVKMDLRRFKRALKAFCGGKKVLNKAW